MEDENGWELLEDENTFADGLEIIVRWGFMILVKFSFFLFRFRFRFLNEYCYHEFCAWITSTA